MEDHTGGIDNRTDTSGKCDGNHFLGDVEGPGFGTVIEPGPRHGDRFPSYRRPLQVAEVWRNHGRRQGVHRREAAIFGVPIAHRSSFADFPILQSRRVTLRIL